MEKRMRVLILCSLFLFTSATINIKNTTQFDVAFGEDPFLVVLNYRSNVIIDWNGPGTTLKTAAESSAVAALYKYKEAIGHAAVFFRKEKNGDILGIGQTGEDHNQGLHLLEHGLGFTSITNIVYTDGSLNNFTFLDTKAYVAMDYKSHGHRGVKFAWIAFKLNDQQSTNIQTYIDKYIASGAYHNYGFPVDPLKFEGGGCTSFANAIVTNSGLDFDLKNYWKRIVPIPYKLMGYSLKVIEETSFTKYDGPILPNKTVSILNPLKYKHWATNGTGYDFLFYDPELFYLLSSFARNSILVKTGKQPITIHDMVKNDNHVDELAKQVDLWINETKQNLQIKTLYDMDGVYVS
eukprot:g3908.t1